MAQTTGKKKIIKKKQPIEKKILVTEKKPILYQKSARKSMPLQSKSPKSNRLVTKRPTQAIGGVKVARIGLVSPKRPTSVRAKSNMSSGRSDQGAKAGYHTARAVTKFNAYETAPA
jgi:hypothetical protein